MQNYLEIPSEVALKDIRKNETSWSPSMFQRVNIPSPATQRIRDLLDDGKPFDRGIEPGSFWYLYDSTHFFIRTKALQDHSNLIYPKGDAVVPINPKVFENVNLSEGDILLSKDSNVGECVIIHGNTWQNHMFSGGIVRLHPIIDRYYLFAFLKHPLFKTQLLAMSPRGATITHAKTLWLDCLIPFPNQGNADSIMCYVSALMRAIIDKEIAIRERHQRIKELISNELSSGQIDDDFFNYPFISEIRTLKRFDAAIYDREYRTKISLVQNYSRGYSTPEGLGFAVTPGPSLEIKLLGTRISSDTYKDGFYALIIPTNITEYGTLRSLPYLGTAKRLPLLEQGDIVFGEAGFQKGRSIVLIDSIERCTTNAHGLYARRTDADIHKSVFFRCIFDWYRSMRLIDLMAVGGSGGHFSPEYFNYLLIPKFPESKQLEIVQTYHNSGQQPTDTLRLENFVEWHRAWNRTLGIWELDREMKTLQQTLAKVQKDIIEGQTVKLQF